MSYRLVKLPAFIANPSTTYFVKFARKTHGILLCIYFVPFRNQKKGKQIRCGSLSCFFLTFYLLFIPTELAPVVQIRGNQDKLVGKVSEEISKLVLRGLFTGLLCRIRQI